MASNQATMVAGQATRVKYPCTMKGYPCNGVGCRHTTQFPRKPMEQQDLLAALTFSQSCVDRHPLPPLFWMDETTTAPETAPLDLVKIEDDPDMSAPMVISEDFFPQLSALEEKEQPEPSPQAAEKKRERKKRATKKRKAAKKDVRLCACGYRLPRTDEDIGRHVQLSKRHARWAGISPEAKAVRNPVRREDRDAYYARAVKRWLEKRGRAPNKYTYESRRAFANRRKRVNGRFVPIHVPETDTQ